MKKSNRLDVGKAPGGEGSQKATDRGFLEGPSTAHFGGQGGAKRVLRQGHCEFDDLLFHLTTIFVADRTIWTSDMRGIFWQKH